LVPICLYCLNYMKFGQLFLRKIIEIVAARCHFLKLKCTKFDFGWGSAPDPAGGAYSALPDSLAGFKGPTSKGRGGKERGPTSKGREDWVGRGRKGGPTCKGREGSGREEEGTKGSGPPWLPKPSYATDYRRVATNQRPV